MLVVSKNLEKYLSSSQIVNMAFKLYVKGAEMKNILHLSCGVLILYILSVVCATVAFANNVEIQYINAGTDRSYVVLSDGSL